MRIHQILTERYVESFSTDDLERLADSIKNKCQSWLSESKNGEIVLFRGAQINFIDTIAYRVPVRQRRQTQGIPILRKIYDEYVLRNLPIKRSNSVSATTSIAVAATFGYACVIIPEGNFEYLWSSDISDWGAGEAAGDLGPLDIPEQLDRIGVNTDDSDLHGLSEYEAEEVEALIEAIKSSLYYNEGLANVPIGHEVMIRAENIYLLPFPIYNKILKLI